MTDAKPYTLPECAPPKGFEHAARAALASTPAPASMPIAEVEAYGMRVARAAIDAAIADLKRAVPETYEDNARGQQHFVVALIDCVDVAAVVKGVK